MKLRVRIITLIIFMLSFFAIEAYGDAKVMGRWSQVKSYRDKMGAELDIRATYYSAEYIEALVTKEAEENLWTADETDQYKYQLLKTLSLDEYIPIHIEFNNNGPSMHLAPFDKHLILWAGKNQLEPADYDKRFNFRLQGRRDGMVFFPRYNEKGKSYLEGVKSVRLAMKGGISSLTLHMPSVDFIWDVARDNPEALYRGRAASRLELDRLIKRIEKLSAEKKELEGRLDVLNSELYDINQRVEELQKQ